MFQVLYNLLGDAYSQIKKTAQAEKWYKAALQAKPDHVPAHLTYGKLLAKNVSPNWFPYQNTISQEFQLISFLQRTRVVEAEQWFLRAKELAPTEPSVYQHFGKFPVKNVINIQQGKKIPHKRQKNFEWQISLESSRTYRNNSTVKHRIIPFSHK